MVQKMQKITEEMKKALEFSVNDLHFPDIKK